MKKYFLVFFTLSAFILACDKDDPVEEQTAIYDPTLYTFDFGDFPDPKIAPDNLPTNAGILLGRMLFYEKMLSKDGSQSCADCHVQQDGFSDKRQFSIGVENLPGKRQAMPVFNVAWHKNGMFWDGRAPLIRDQALLPIQDPLEMNETLGNAITKLKADKRYTDQFIRAFGDDNVTPERIGKAIEQFEVTMISNNSKFDKWKRGAAELTESEERGRQLFFTEYDPFSGQKGGECFHCHGGFNFTNDQFMNNGLDEDADFKDEGHFKVTNNPLDLARFKVPSLRNVELTAPYMHDGRFATLEEVIEHYNSGVKNSATIDPLMQYNLNPGLQLTTQDKADLIAFLKTLTDYSFLEDERFSSPF